MQIIDAQEHELGPNLDWNDNDVETQYKAQTEILLAWMDAVGVDYTLVNPINEPVGHAAVKLCPERLACFISIRDPEAPDIEDRAAHALETPGVVGLRASFGVTNADPKGEIAEAKFHAGAYDRLFSSCQEHQVPLFCGAYGFAKLIGASQRSCGPGLHDHRRPHGDRAATGQPARRATVEESAELAGDRQEPERLGQGVRSTVTF